MTPVFHDMPPDSTSLSELTTSLSSELDLHNDTQPELSITENCKLDRIRNKTGVFDYDNMFGDVKEAKLLWDKLDKPESNSYILLFIYLFLFIVAYL